MKQKDGALEQQGRYLRVEAAGRTGGFAVSRSSMKLLRKVDAVVFDCDGVLIDARRSYDATIRVVVEAMVEEMTWARLRLARLAPRLISTIRRTGGFNSDWDTTYALTLFSMAALEARSKSGGARGPGAAEALTGITAGFGSAPRARGREAVDSFLDAEFPSLKESLDRSRDYLGYPRTPPEGRMTTAFDELYFGGSLFQRVHGVRAKNPRVRGLIELERTLVTKKTLDSLAEILGGARIAMVTGRPFVGTEHSLGKEVMKCFDRDSSMFIGDADIDPKLRGAYDEYRKPSPKGLVRAKEKLSSSTLLYVGDSAEDLMMVQNARRRGLEGYLFAGVYQTSTEPARQASFFERGSSDMIAESVNQVPSGLLLQQKDEGAGEA